MARTLKTTGVATKLIMCLAVDDDDTTIVEFVDSAHNSNMTVDADMTVSTGDTWKSTSFPKMVFTADGGFNVNGITFGVGFEPDNGTGGAMIMVLGTLDGASNNSGAIYSSTQGDWFGTDNDAANAILQWRRGGSVGADTDTNTVAIGTKQSIASWYPNAGSGTARFWQGLESGSLTELHNEAAAGTNIRMPVEEVGGSTGQGNRPMTVFAVLMFDSELSLAEVQGIHDNFPDEIFETGGPPADPYPDELQSYHRNPLLRF